MWWVGIKEPARLLESFVCLHVSQLLSRDTITLATEVVDIQLPEPIAQRTDGIVADSPDVPILDSGDEIGAKTSLHGDVALILCKTIVNEPLDGIHEKFILWLHFSTNNHV
jgi:hypothetical protein